MIIFSYYPIKVSGLNKNKCFIVIYFKNPYEFLLNFSMSLLSLTTVAPKASSKDVAAILQTKRVCLALLLILLYTTLN